jgi:hypothetical protein
MRSPPKSVVLRCHGGRRSRSGDFDVPGRDFRPGSRRTAGDERGHAVEDPAEAELQQVLGGEGYTATSEPVSDPE